ncbi:type I methionyl aminopeptidase [Myxococcota bacterium]|nr:type I methionyl aminopeptidase [Myxococcota bacterium]
MRTAGRLLAEAIAEVRAHVAVGVTPRELDRIFEQAIAARGARSAFKGYDTGAGPFPATICASRNEQVVHGIPDDRPLNDGDLISLDFGLEYGGYFADSAFSMGVGTVTPKVQRLLDITEKSLYKAISLAVPGARIGDLGHSVQSLCESEGFGVVRDLVGHGIGRRMHEPPSVPNFGKRGTGVPLKPGVCLAIEPMITMGDYRTRTLKDGWTVVTTDGSFAAHFEHTVLITENGPEILTAPLR